MSSPLPGIDAVAAQFVQSVRSAARSDVPFRHWLLTDVFPTAFSDAVVALPIDPAARGKTDGTRDSYNDSRTFITTEIREAFPVCDLWAETLQRPDVARLMAETCNIAVEGSHLRMEYIQDTNGATLAPHLDIKEKLFTMLVYLCSGPEAANLGTDLYDADLKWVGRTPAGYNSGLIFVPGTDTWHGLEERPIVGVRKLMQISYVSGAFRDRHQFCFSERPIRLD